MRRTPGMVFAERLRAEDARPKGIKAAARALLDRLDEVERDLPDGQFSSDYLGHVGPAKARLRTALKES